MEKIDYGRLAYEKIGDLEARIGTHRQDKIESVKIKKKHDITCEGGEEIVLAEFFGLDQVFSVVVKLNLSMVDSEFKVKLFHNDILSGEYNGADSVFLCVLSAGIDGVNVLKITTEGTAFIESSEVLVIGYEINTAQPAMTSDVVIGQNSVLVWRYRDDIVEAAVCAFEDLGEELEFRLLARTNKVCVCSVGDDFEFFFEDRSKNVFFSRWSDGQLSFFANGIEIVSYCSFPFSRFLIYKRAGKLYYRQCIDGKFFMEKPFDTGAIVSSISGVSSSTVPAFIISNNGQNYIKVAAKECVANDALRITPQIQLI